MTPLPKNKITRAERGKRRQGNTPSLRCNVKKAPVPLYKSKLAQKIKLILTATLKVDQSAQKAKLADKLALKRGKKVGKK